MLWILIRSASPRQGASKDYPQHVFLWRNRKKNIFQNYLHTIFLNKSSGMTLFFPVARPICINAKHDNRNIRDIAEKIRWHGTSETYFLKCAHSEDSDQPAHSRSLIRIFTERILDNQGKFLHADNETFTRRRKRAEWFKSSSDAHVRRYVFSRCGSLCHIEQKMRKTCLKVWGVWAWYYLSIDPFIL